MIYTLKNKKLSEVAKIGIEDLMLFRFVVDDYLKLCFIDDYIDLDLDTHKLSDSLVSDFEDFLKENKIAYIKISDYDDDDDLTDINIIPQRNFNFYGDTDHTDNYLLTEELEFTENAVFEEFSFDNGQPVSQIISNPFSSNVSEEKIKELSEDVKKVYKKLETTEAALFKLIEVMSQKGNQEEIKEVIKKINQDPSNDPWGSLLK